MLQNQIADVVAECVVDALEVIDIERYKCDGHSFLLDVGQRLVKGSPICQTGQRIGLRG